MAVATAPTTSPEVRSLANVATNFRRTSQYYTLGKKIFSKDVLSMQPTAITQLMRAAGIPVPKSVLIGADAAQIIVSGGAFMTAVETGQSIGSYAVPAIAALQAAIDLMETVGWMDRNSPIAFWLTLGTDAAMVAATMGTNVIADVKLALDVIQGFSVPSAEPLAQGKLQQYLYTRRKAQTDALTLNIQSYTRGDISIFGFMGKIAEESPDYFSNYFPQQGFFFPQVYQDIIASAHTVNMFNTSSDTAYASSRIFTLGNNSHSFVESTIWTKIILPYFSSFKRLADIQKQSGGISVENLALLTLVPPYIKIFNENFNALDLFKVYSLTPYDMGDNFLEDFLNSKIDRENLTAPMTINGVDYFTPYQQQKRAMNAYEKNLLRADETGQIQSLMKDSQSKAALSIWGKPKWTGLSGVQVPGLYTKTVTNEMGTMSQRSFFNYFSALSVLEKVRTDSYFNDMSQVISQYDILGKIDDLEARHKKLLAIIQCRLMNKKAVENIAAWMNTTPSNLVVKNYGEVGKPAIFDYKT